MNKKTKLIIAIIVLLIIFGLVASFVGAEQLKKNSVCCEKTTDGAYCINTDKSKCDANFMSSPGACPSTNYCALGTCYDSVEGICMENTPKIICDQSKGTWSQKPASELEQCQLGCCVLADQVAFIPKVRCMRLATLYGIGVDYRPTIKTESECVDVARNQDYGACVYSEEFQKKCRFTTREDCSGTESYLTNASVTKDGKNFYENYLCSAEELNTICARQATTGCYGGDVYWYDSCGNRENIFSSDKTKSWNNGKIFGADLVCSPDNGDNTNCGNCDYLLGTRCALYDSGTTSQSKPSSGNYYCRATECKDREGNTRKNGESWCIYEGATGTANDLVGSRHYREVCMDGEVIVEPCAEYRSERCIQSSITTTEGDFSVADCRINRWQDCVVQLGKKDCENTDKRDCSWVSVPLNTKQGTPKKTIVPSTQTDSRGACVPRVSPGLKFWEVGSGSGNGTTSSDAATVCNQGTITCQVAFKQSLLEVWTGTGNDGYNQCLDGGAVWNGKSTNCECLKESWAVAANNYCRSLGDCGAYTNINGKLGDSGYLWTIDGKQKKFSLASEQSIIKNAPKIGIQLVKEMK